MNTTNVLRRLALGSALPIAAVTLVAPAAAAEPTEPTLRHLCESRGGNFFDTPFDFGRCQEARPRRHRDDPFAAEREVCADSFGGTITAVPSFNRPRRITWVCR